MDDPATTEFTFLEAHKKNILQNIKSVSELDGESGKYLWAALYHNQYLDSAIEKKEDTAELWITDEDLPLLANVADSPLRDRLATE